jgi:membrane protein YqaA with SNARE-associated domain
MEYIYLFINAFVSATFFPLGSEALLLFYLSNNFHYLLLLISASFGNTLGSVLNYWFGLQGESYLIQKKLISKNKIQKYKIYFDKYGSYTLLFSWLPIVGDIFTLIAGMLQYNIKKFIVLVFIAKTFRYIFVIYGFYYFVT